jgi:hypothetical protein
MAQGIFTAGFVLAADKIDIEEILPAFASQGARLHLGQINISQGKHG